ncbi:hypothetical protein IMZ48_09575 [Candidatus Bathyarchaeota archaeon]|nr:hypothetical protein [Candidatus Bathyarchaeota archaeon]
MAHNKTTPSLATLPGEIQDQIIPLLDGFQKLLLRGTNRHFRHITTFTVDDLASAERASLSHGIDLYGCYAPACLRLRRPHQFCDGMKKKRFRKEGKDPIKRFCIDCGLSPGFPKQQRFRYHRITHIFINHALFVACGCGRWGLVPRDEDCFHECRWTCRVCFVSVEGRRCAGACYARKRQRVAAGLEEPDPLEDETVRWVRDKEFFGPWD